MSCPHDDNVAVNGNGGAELAVGKAARAVKLGFLHPGRSVETINVYRAEVAAHFVIINSSNDDHIAGDGHISTEHVTSAGSIWHQLLLVPLATIVGKCISHPGTGSMFSV